MTDNKICKTVVSEEVYTNQHGSDESRCDPTDSASHASETSRHSTSTTVKAMLMFAPTRRIFLADQKRMAQF